MSAKTKGGAPAQKGAFDRFFHLSERGATIGSEIRGGFVTFFTMAYILVLNPIILSGPDSTGKFLGGGDEANKLAIAAATALIAGIVTLLMGAFANYPLALAAGLGLNSMVASVVKIDGMTWADGMGIIVLEGVVVLLLVLTGLRQAIFNAVPKFLRTAISVGIGLFVALIGLVNAGLIRTGAGTVLDFASSGSIDSLPMLIFIIGLILTFLFMVKKVRGGILISIIVTTILAVIVEAVAKLGFFNQWDEQGNPIDPNLSGWHGNSLPKLEGSPIQMPDFATLGDFSVVTPFQHAGVIAAVVLVFSALLADFFDTMGTMVAVGSEGNLLDKDGNPYNSQKILLVDSVGAIAGGLGGVSSNTSYIESASGVADGARTGLASIVTGVLFLLSIFLAPLVAVVPAEAAAPALIAVGFLMMQQVTDIDWKDMAIAIPAFLTIILMPFGYSITVGIGVGFIFYVLMQIIRGKAKEVHPLMWGVAVIFLVYFVRGPIQSIVPWG